MGRLYALGMRKTGVPLESHKLWRELVRLETEERNKVLQQIVDKKFTIGDATQVTNLTIQVKQSNPYY